MADINKVDIRLMASQRLDDTNQGGGQMTSVEVISGAINNLYPDISRLDRVYGRVSLRKAFLSVQTAARQTYYGSHAALTRNATDPNVSVCFFSSEDWYDTREDAKSRIEAYLVKGPFYPAALWGNHYVGSRTVQLHTYKTYTAPEIGDVLVLVQNEDLANEKKQYVRITNVTEEVQEFIYSSSTLYYKKIITLEIGDMLQFDFTGEEIFWEGAGLHYGAASQDTKVYTTVAADASRYYGVATLAEDANDGELQVRVDSINVPLVPSAQSQTPITDAGVGQAITPMLQTSNINTAGTTYTTHAKFILAENSTLEVGKALQAGSLSVSGGYTMTDNGVGGVLHNATVIGTIDYDTGIIVFNDQVVGVTEYAVDITYVPTIIVKVVRSIVYTIAANSKLFIGEGVLPGSFSWAGGLSLVDDSSGNVLNNGTIVGSITYSTGIIVFTNVTGSTSGTGTATYIPACQPTEVACTGGIQVDINNRGFAYVYNCDPLPKKGTLKIDYLAGGKWYTMWDRGDGAIRGYDMSIGSGSVNLITGSLSLSLGAMPDVGSMIMIFWAKDAPYYDFAGDVLTLEYKFKTQNEGIARNTFICSWLGDTVAVMDDGNGNLKVASGGPTWAATGAIVGSIKYASGDIEFKVHTSQSSPLSSENFWIRYSYGDTYEEEFNPIRNGDGTVTFYLTNTPVVPGTFKIEWHTDQEEYDGTSGIRRHIDPTHVYQDDTSGNFKFEAGYGSSINYTNGQVHLMPDRRGVFPVPTYIWKRTGLFDEFHVELKEFVFVNLEYRPAASIWPTDGIIKCWYRCTDGANTASYYLELPKQFYIRPNSNLEIVPGSLSFDAGAFYITDIGTGRLFHSIVGTSGIGTECGTINYASRIVTITDDAVIAKTLNVRSCAGTAAIDPVQFMVFRAPGAPIVPGSFGVRATLGTGTIISGTSNFAGEITGTGIVGSIDYTTGVARVSFGAWVTDVWVALPIEDQPEWYIGAPIDGTLVWKPYSVRASTVMINCVISSYLPLDSGLLGLDPVRLPMDGKVPIFRDGYIILIHHTVKENLPNPVVLNTTYNLSRGNVELIELYDSTGLYFPEAEGGHLNYTYNLVAGTVKIESTAVVAGYTQPFYAIHRQEDMALASDVQITGHIAITNPLKHSYVKDETLVSSVLPSADLQARAYNEFVQSAWTGVWSDDIIGAIPLANYNFVDFPITVTNEGATKERWLIKFTTSTTFDVIGEHLGVLMTGISLAGTDGWTDESGTLYLDIVNRLTNKKYLRLAKNGFGAGWASGNCIRWNTDAANFPYWFVRTTLQAPPTEPTDSYEFQIRGDSA